jgi:hypothetical protein
MDWAFPVFPYGGRWRLHRRLFYSFFNQNVVNQWHPQELRATHALLHRLHETPEKFWDHLRLYVFCLVVALIEHDMLYRMASSLILDFAYGIDAKSVDDPILQLIEKSMHVVSKATIPGVFLVDTLPFRMSPPLYMNYADLSAVKHVPEWMPGAGFKKQAREWNVIVQATADRPLEYVKDAMAGFSAKRESAS